MSDYTRQQFDRLPTTDDVKAMRRMTRDQARTLLYQMTEIMLERFHPSAVYIPAYHAALNTLESVGATPSAAPEGPQL